MLRIIVFVWNSIANILPPVASIIKAVKLSKKNYIKSIILYLLFSVEIINIIKDKEKICPQNK